MKNGDLFVEVHHRRPMLENIHIPEDVLARMTTRQRRLMGDLGEGYKATDYFKPKDQIEVIMDGLDFECPNI